jgi:hypothetical protein
MTDPQKVIVPGALPNDFANEIAAAIDTAQERGLDLDVAVCVAVGVAADYARAEYGDNCHSTGVVRGLLCHSCNLGIGHLKDDVRLVESALRYLMGSLS